MFVVKRKIITKYTFRVSEKWDSFDVLMRFSESAIKKKKRSHPIHKCNRKSKRASAKWDIVVLPFNLSEKTEKKKNTFCVFIAIEVIVYARVRSSFCALNIPDNKYWQFPPHTRSIVPCANTCELQWKGNLKKKKTF